MNDIHVFWSCDLSWSPRTFFIFSAHRSFLNLAAQFLAVQ
jgi:hypothetical protein